MTINKGKLITLNDELEKNVIDVTTKSDEIVTSYTQVLDDIMKDIKEEIIDKEDITDNLLNHYFLSLTNAIYFISSKVEAVGFYDDLSKVSFKLAYNDAYSKNQTKDVGNTKKQTVADNQMAAENGSIDEQVLNIIYSRSFKIIKTKIDAAYEMIRTLSKIISSRQQEKQLTMIGTKESA